MKRLISYLTIFIIFILASCQTTIKYIKVPLSTPPEKYYIPQISDRRDLMKAYQESVMRISEWQLWYNINSGTNAFNYEEMKK
mgnify:CR=1 FL=1